MFDPTKANATAPKLFWVELETTKGVVTLEIYRDWSPLGVDRFYNLVMVGFFDDIAFFRVIDGFMVQFGMSGIPEVQRAWDEFPLQDDPPVTSNRVGTIAFAKTKRPNTRTTQVFINYRDNEQLDSMGFVPFGRVIKGMDVVESLYAGYGEGAPAGRGPNQKLIEREGNAYLRQQFPELDWMIRARITLGHPAASKN